MLLSLKLLLSVLLLLLTHVPGAQAAEPPTPVLFSDSASASTGNSTLSPSQAEGIAAKGIAAKVTGPEISGHRISGYSQLREIGYQIGDIATQTIHATTPVGYSLDRSSLPVLGEVGASLQLLSADYRQYASGTKHTLRLRWQSFRAMQEIRGYALLPLRLQFRNGDKVLELQLKAPSILVASTLPTVMDSKHALLQPAVKPVPIATHSIKQQLLVSLGLLATALSYLVWRYDWWPCKRKTAPPFRQAWRQLNRHSRLRRHFLVNDKTVKDEAAQSQHVSMQMRILRRAFDNSLGVALSAERLPLLYQQLPWLLPLQTEIDAFFAESERVFFSGDKSLHKPTYKPRYKPTYKPRHDRQHASDNYTVALSRRLMLLESDAA